MMFHSKGHLSICCVYRSFLFLIKIEIDLALNFFMICSLILNGSFDNQEYLWSTYIIRTTLAPSSESIKKIFRVTNQQPPLPSRLIHWRLRSNSYSQFCTTMPFHIFSRFIKYRSRSIWLLSF